MCETYSVYYYFSENLNLFDDSNYEILALKVGTFLRKFTNSRTFEVLEHAVF